MMLPESPKALAFDGTLVSAVLYAVAHFESAIVWALSIVILTLRAMLLYRQWRRG
jgi:lysozyme family protein